MRRPWKETERWLLWSKWLSKRVAFGRRRSTRRPMVKEHFPGCRTFLSQNRMRPCRVCCFHDASSGSCTRRFAPVVYSVSWQDQATGRRHSYWTRSSITRAPRSTSRSTRPIEMPPTSSPLSPKLWSRSTRSVLSWCATVSPCAPTRTVQPWTWPVSCWLVAVPPDAPSTVIALDDVHLVEDAEVTVEAIRAWFRICRRAGP